MKDALLHCSEKQNPKCFFKVISQDWEVKMNPVRGLDRGGCFHKHLFSMLSHEIILKTFSVP